MKERKEISFYLIRKVLCLFMILCLMTGGITQGVQASTPGLPDYGNHWAKETIEHWIELGLVKGFSDDSFRPDQPITRAEFMAFTNRAFGFATGSAVTFRDVGAEDWYASDVGRAVAAGYIQGYSDNTVRPTKEVRRQEAALMVQRILSLETEPAAAISLVDQETIADWSRGAIGAVASQNIMGGYPDGRFLPNRALTRAEAVVLLDKAISVWEPVQNITLDDAGETFGPNNSTKRIVGDVVVSAPDMTLQNLIIEGDLIIRETVGEADVNLHHVDVQGTMLVHGGGSDSIHLNDSTVIRLVIDKEEGTVRIVVSGNTFITETVVYSSVKLDAADDLEGEGFQNVTLYGSDLEMRIIQAVIDLLHVTEEVEDSYIYLVNDSKIIELINEGRIEIIDSGSSNESGSSGSGSSSDPEPTVTSVTYTPESLSLIGIGQTASIELTAYWSDSTTSDVTAEALWSSDDESAATVNKGVVMAQGEGTTVIRAEYDSFEFGIPLSVVSTASYANITPDLDTIVAGENISVTFAVYRSDGSLDTDFDGEKTISVSGYTPDGISGNFEGTALTGSFIHVAVIFNDGMASGNLILHHAAEQTISIDVLETDDGAESFTITPEANEASKLVWVQKPSASVQEYDVFDQQPTVQMADIYGNTVDSVSTGTVTASVYDSVSGMSTLQGTLVVDILDGQATFTDLELKGTDTGVKLSFTSSDPEIVSLISDPIEVTALFSLGNGVDEPYIIEDAEQLFQLHEADFLDKDFTLSADIVLPTGLSDYGDDGGWDPIGENGNPYTGTFDGGGHTISNLTIERNADYQGMFGHVNGGHIHNLILENATVDTVTTADPTGKSYVGLLVGKLDGEGSVTDVEVSGEVSGYENVGGLLGSLSGTVSGAKADVEVTGKLDNTGGMIGENHGTVTDSHAVGHVLGGESCVDALSCGNTGGLIGHNQESGIVSHVYATGSVVMPVYNNFSGGLIGRNRGSVTKAFATGSVSSPMNAGGLIGWNNGEVTDVYATGSLINVNYAGGLISFNSTGGTISNAYATGTVSGENSAGLIKSNYGTTIQQSYYYQEPHNGIGSNKTVDEMKQRATYIGWDFEGEDAIWKIVEDVTFPTLIWQDS